MFDPASMPSIKQFRLDVLELALLGHLDAATARVCCQLASEAREDWKVEQQQKRDSTDNQWVEKFSKDWLAALKKPCPVCEQRQTAPQVPSHEGSDTAHDGSPAS